MNSHTTSDPATFAGRSASRRRDPLQIPVELASKEDTRLARILEATREVVLWLAIVFVAATGALFVGAMAPELRAAVPDQPRESPAIVQPAPQAGEVREWYLPDVLFNDKAEPAEPIEAF
ncbi:MAG: hypothetical protein ABW205_13525 [Burkholderiales bacterium]|jgi:hypothetical protein